MHKLEKILYTARAHTTGGREGHSVTDDGILNLRLTPPKAMGGSGEGTNPEQLLAVAYAACFMGAMKHVANTQKISMPADAAIDSVVSIGPIPPGFGLAVELHISLPGMDHAQAQDLIEKAHHVCPYSNATRNNIEVKLVLV
jgi:Ohr subfamily peroxiredoxin